MPTLEPYLGGFYLWHYIPNQPAAIVFAIFFSIATGLHGWKMFRTRMWFCLPFFIGGICAFPQALSSAFPAPTLSVAKYT